jgi:hypothetical protein
MKNAGILRLVLGAAVLAAVTSLGAADHYKVLNGPKEFYFGHISLVEEVEGGAAPVVIREGNPRPEEGVLNLPIGPGDTVRTSGDRRCEIQFDTGTIVRLDFATEVRVETILARSLSSLEELSVLTLAKGRLFVMYKEYDRREMFQILTANAAVKLHHNAVAFVTAAADGATETQVKYGRAQVLFGPAEKQLDDQTVKKGERLIVLAGHQSELAPAVEGTAFELWNNDINAHFDQLHAGLSALPKPLQKLPPAVFYFAQAYGNAYGEWLWDDLYGYIWHPYIDNGRYPWGWSPYYYGFWSYSGGQMYWVPQEPWGWVPYHLGIWQWDKKHGWFWMPGSMFAPAWVDWDFYFGYASWRPWSMFDWMYPIDLMNGDPYMYGSDPFWISYFRYEHSQWEYYWPFAAGNGASSIPGGVRTALSKDALKQPRPGSLPIPADLRSVVKRVASAYEKGDARVRDSAAAVPSQLVLVSKADLASRAVHEKALTWDKVEKHGAPASGEKSAPLWVRDPQREAGHIVRGINGPAAAPRRTIEPGARTIQSGGMTAVPNNPVVADDPVAAGNPVAAAKPAVRNDAPEGSLPGRAAPAGGRFRDWNPDLKVARELGVHIEYSSIRNEVRCPELKISSRDRERSGGLTPRMTPDGVSFGPATGGGEYAAGSGSTASSASGSPSPASGKTQSDRTSSSTGSKETKGGGSEGGKIKN